MQRIFIGIPVDKQSQRLINELLKPIRESRNDIHWVPESNRHLTLAFMGDRPGFEVDDLLGGFDEAYQHGSCFQFLLSALTRFPNRRGRIVALTGQPDRPLEEIVHATRKLLDKYKVEFDQKSFRPHITLARIRNAERVKRVFDQPTDITLDISSVVLYQSTLTEAGAVYTRLKEFELAQ